MEKALVIFSGGQDSVTCLHWALNRYADVRAITFDYGQKHKIEIDQAKKIAELNKVEWELIRIPKMAGRSPLTNHDETLGKYDHVGELPEGIEPTFVAARNLIFISYAVNRAAAWGSTSIIMGICEEDNSGYPECREPFIDSLEHSIQLSLDGVSDYIKIITPVINLTKAETVKLADKEGAWASLALSQTCYEGLRPPCGLCHSCHLRREGFNEAGYKDPLFG